MASETLLPFAKVLGVLAYRITSEIIGIGSAERSWGDFKTIKPVKISALGSDIYEKQSIVYTYTCIEEAIFLRTLSNTDSKDGSQSHSWYDNDHAFEYQSYQRGVEKLFHNSDEVIIIELKMYVEDREKSISRTRTNYRVPCFLQNIVIWLYVI